MNKKYNIVILERNSVGSDVSVSMFEELGNVTAYETTTPDQIAERVKDADIVLINKSPINESTIGNAPDIKLVGEFATGYDNVDINYCKSRGIAVTNVRGYSTSAVVQHTFALCLYVTEHLKYYDEYVKSGEYEKSGFFTHYGQTFGELCGKTWGIIGLGNIGRRVADIAKAFGANVIYTSPSGQPPQEGYHQVDLDTLLRTSDIISVHAPLNEYTENLIDHTAFCKMKSSCIFLNLGRGAIVVDADLADALKDGRIAAAGLDVLPIEPMSADSPFREIKDSKRLLITPHIAWASVESRTRLMKIIYGQVQEFFYV